jgi:hypothetical protein
MNRFTFLILVLFFLVACSCSGRRSKLDRRHLIPEKKLTALITDVYISDGLLSLPNIRNLFSNMDSTSCYIEVIKKHGYTKEDMDKTMKYYFIENPKQLIKIYDQVLAILSEMQARYEKEVSLIQGKVSNYWTGHSIYSFPDPSGNDSSNFDINVPNAGLFTLSFTITLYPDDQSFNPRVTLYTCHPDSIETGKRHYIRTVNYLKDGLPHTYLLYIRTLNKSSFHIRGLLYNSDNLQDYWVRHLRIEKISYTFTSG